MPFFTSTAPKKAPQVFAGLDDPFNFPASKMRYTSRTTSRSTSRTPSRADSSADSGYGSIDDSSSDNDKDRPLSPTSHAPPPRHKKRLQKDSKGHWRVQSYEYQSQNNDARAEIQPIMRGDSWDPKEKLPDNAHEWKPNLKHTFTLITADDAPPKREKWFAKRVYGRAMREKERSEGLTQLQRDMAPVLRRASPSPSPLPSSAPSGHRPTYGPRKKSTLLHPSPPLPPLPPSASSHTSTSTSTTPTTTDSSPRGRTLRKPSTLLHPSAPSHPGATIRLVRANDQSPEPRQQRPGLRSPRHRSPTPLGIPTSSERQPAPTPLRIVLRRESVLHSCFSDSEDERGDADEEEGEGGDGDAMSDVASVASAAFPRNEVILARTALVARAQRVRVGSPGEGGW